MASKVAGRTGAVRSARSPGRSPSPRKEAEPSLEREQALQKQLNDLQKYKEQEEKDKKKEEAAKKKELTAAKKRITKEVQNATKAVKKYDQEVNKLSASIKKFQSQESDIKKKTADSENKFREKLHTTQVKHDDLEIQLAKKHADAAQERIKLQQLQLQLDTLTGNNIDLSKPGVLPAGLSALENSGRKLPALNDSGVETTDAEGEERYAFAESEVARLAQQLDDMRLQWEEAEEQKRELAERLGELEQSEGVTNGEDIERVHQGYREAMDTLRSELQKVQDENQLLREKLNAMNKALEMQEECIEELAGRASGVGEGLMEMASNELARASVIQSESRLASNPTSRRDSAEVSADEGGAIAWRSVVEGEAVSVGELVRLNVDNKMVREAFRSVGYAWTEMHDAMLGQSFHVVEVPKQGIVGLPSPDGSQGGVWYFPVVALQKAAASQPPTPGSASATASTAATYQRASHSKGRPASPSRTGYQGGGSGRTGLALSGSTSSIPVYGGQAQAPQSPTTGSVASTQVFVGSVPAELSDDRLMAEFAKYGVVVDIQVQRDESGPQKSYAFLTFQTQEEASRAVEAATGGRLILPGASMPSEVGFARGAQASSTGQQVVVRGIPAETPDDAIVAELAKYGTIVNVHVQRDPAGPEKSSALVTYQNRDDAMRILEVASGGRLILPGAVMPCEVALVRSGHVAGQPATSRPQASVGAQQVIIYSVPLETADDLLMAEFAKFGTVVEFKVQRDPSGPNKSYALVTYSTSQEAARAIEVTNGRLMMPGAVAPAQVGFVPISGQPVAPVQLLTAREKLGVAGQQVRSQSAPRPRPSPGLVSPVGMSVMAGGVDIRRQVSGMHGDVIEAEPTAWSSADQRRYVVQGGARPDGYLDLSASGGAIRSGRPMVVVQRPWQQAGLPSEPIAGDAAVRQLSPVGGRFLAGPVGSSPTLGASGSAVAPAGPPHAEPVQHQQFLQVPGQGGRVIYRSPGVVPTAAAAGTASPGVLMMPTQGAAWRGAPAPQQNPWANAPRTQQVTSGPPSYTPPATAVQGAAPVAGTVLPSASGGALAQTELDQTTSGTAGTNFREAVAKVTAKALREYRSNHRASLNMD